MKVITNKGGQFDSLLRHVVHPKKSSKQERRSQPINDAAKLQLLQPLSATSGDCGSLLGRDVATVKEAREGEGDFNAEYRRL